MFRQLRPPTLGSSVRRVRRPAAGGRSALPVSPSLEADSEELSRLRSNSDPLAVSAAATLADTFSSIAAASAPPAPSGTPALSAAAALSRRGTSAASAPAPPPCTPALPGTAPSAAAACSVPPALRCGAIPPTSSGTALALNASVATAWGERSSPQKGGGLPAAPCCRSAMPVSATSAAAAAGDGAWALPGDGPASLADGVPAQMCTYFSQASQHLDPQSGHSQALVSFRASHPSCSPAKWRQAHLGGSPACRETSSQAQAARPAPCLPARGPRWPHQRHVLPHGRVLPHLARGRHPTAKRPSTCARLAFPSFPRAGDRASWCHRSGESQGQPFGQRLLSVVTACSLPSGLWPPRPALLFRQRRRRTARRHTGGARAHNPFRSVFRARRVAPLPPAWPVPTAHTPALERTALSQQTGQFWPRCLDNLGRLRPLAPQLQACLLWFFGRVPPDYSGCGASLFPACFLCLGPVSSGRVNSDL